MRAMISQPMRGRTDEEILATRVKAKAVLEAKGFEVVDTFFQEQWAEEDGSKFPTDRHKGIWFLAESLKRMAFCHAVYFCAGWEQAAGCQIEHVVAMKYGLKVIEEETTR